MLSNEGPVREITQQERANSFTRSTMPAAHYLNSMLGDHKGLDVDHAVVSTEEAEILAKAAEITTRIHKAAMAALESKKPTATVIKSSSEPHGTF